MGFLFPAFNDRAADLYHALYYTRSSEDVHQSLIDSVFHTPALRSAKEQKGAFDAVLQDSLDQDCSFDLVQSVHEQLRTVIQDYKESKNPDPLQLSPQEVGVLLKNSGLEDEKVKSFTAACEKEFGDGASLDPVNIVDAKRFEIKTPQIRITVDPDYSYLVETQVIRGRNYLLIPTDGDVELNGASVQFPRTQRED